MADNRNTITAIVMHFLKTKLKESGMHRYEEVLNVALWGLRELTMDAGGQLQATKILTMNSYKAIDMPPGFVDWTLVGIINNKTIQYISKAGEKISLSTKAFSGDINAAPSPLNFIGTLSSTDKFFVEDWVNKQLKFSSAVQTGKVQLGYITDGLDVDGETIVHPYAQNYVLKYLINEMTPDGSSEREMYNAETRYRARTSDLDPLTLLQIFRDTNPGMYGGV